MPDPGSPAGARTGPSGGASGGASGPGDWLDWPRAMALVADDAELLVHLVRVFVRQYANGAAELRAARNDGHWPDASRRAHKLAGAAGAIGAVSLERLAREAEVAAHAMTGAGGNHDVQQRARQTTDALIAQLEATLHGAIAWCARQGTGG